MATPSLASLGHTITEKLNRENFLVWRAQVLPHVRAAGMMGFLDGSQKEPDAEIRTEKDVAGKKEVTVAANPEHAIWVTQDQQVLSFLIASLSREVLLQVSNCTTAAAPWSALLQRRSRLPIWIRYRSSLWDLLRMIPVQPCRLLQIVFYSNLIDQLRHLLCAPTPGLKVV